MSFPAQMLEKLTRFYRSHFQPVASQTEVKVFSGSLFLLKSVTLNVEVLPVLYRRRMFPQVLQTRSVWSPSFSRALLLSQTVRGLSVTDSALWVRNTSWWPKSLFRGQDILLSVSLQPRHLNKPEHPGIFPVFSFLKQKKAKDIYSQTLLMIKRRFCCLFFIPFCQRPWGSNQGFSSKCQTSPSLSMIAVREGVFVSSIKKNSNLLVSQSWPQIWSNGQPRITSCLL